ncbi:MAG: transporter substrate-binding domain-containing protein [Lachnospiraceae bacterium]|nr:transporter substrate-binding domain-containing protein [Lachnospiraceae bacterium]
MKKQKKYRFRLKYGIVGLVAILFVLLIPFQAEAKEKSNEKVRVGFYRLDGYHMQDEDGNRSGYGYEFLQKIGRYLPYTYEYVGYDKSWKDMLEMLEKGEIDILTSGGKTPERERKFEYSENDIGNTVTILAVKEGDERFKTKDYATYDGARLGFLRNSSRNESFQKYAEENHFTYIPVYYDTYADMELDLQEGKIDGIISGNIRKIENEWIVDQFEYRNFYVMAPKGDRSLLDEIDKAIEQLNRDEPGWRTTLMNKSYIDSSTENISLTREEQNYLTDLKNRKTVLKVVVNPDRSPYSYVEDGEVKGIIPTIFEKVAEKLDLSYEILETGTRKEYYQKLESGEADICMDSGFVYSEAEKVGYELTDPYMSTGFSRITKQNFSGDIRSIASMEKPYLLRDYLENRFSDLDIQYYDSIEECLHAVETGKADATFLYTYTVQEVINHDLRNPFTSTIMGVGYASFSIAVRNDMDPRLLTSLNKAVAHIKNNEIENIILENTENLQNNQSLTEFLYHNPGYLIIIVVIMWVFAVMIGIAIIAKRNQKRLQKAYDEVNAANNAKKDFLSKMSHDIRTPMNAIIGMTDIMEQNAADEQKVREYLTKMRVSENYMLTLLNEVLDMSKFERGVMELKKEEFGMKDLLADIKLVIGEMAKLKDQEFHIDVEGIIHTRVIGDSKCLEQILLNLLSNAVKYTNRHGEISLYVSETEPGCFLFRVKDNGMGIPPEYQEKVFEEFFRVEDSRVSQIQGTGLGLTLVRKYVELLEGTLSLKSEEGKGTEVQVRIPMEVIEEKQEKLSPESDEEGELSKLTGLRVLLVEDNELNREIAQELLYAMDVQVDCAENGKVGVEKFTASSVGFYDAVLMDLQMPVMNGLDACRSIRSSGREDEKIPVFALTANAYAQDIEDTKQAGMNAHIMKPIDVPVLYGLLKKVYKEKNEHV